MLENSYKLIEALWTEVDSIWRRVKLTSYIAWIGIIMSSYCVGRMTAHGERLDTHEAVYADLERRLSKLEPLVIGEQQVEIVPRFRDSEPDKD